MKSYTFSEARQRLADLLSEAKKEGGVRIYRRDGQSFVLAPELRGKSPLDVPGLESKVSTSEIVSLLRRNRRQKRRY